MSSIVISGDVSGAATIVAPSAAGTPTLTLPTTSGTLVVGGTTPSFSTLTVTGNTNLATSSGNVGIGTSSPTAPLTIVNSAVGEVLRLTSSAANVYGLASDGTVSCYMGGALTGTGGFAGTASNHPYTIRTNNSEVMRVETSGNVGFGITGSTSKICVNKTNVGTYGHMNNGNSAPGGSVPWLASLNGVDPATAGYGWAIYDSNTTGNLETWRRNNDTTGLIVTGLNRSTGQIAFGTSTYANSALLSCNYGTSFWQFGSSTTGSNIFWVLNSGGTGVSLTSGNTSWAAQSDERLKDIIEPITNGAEKVASLRPVIGKYKTDEEGTRRSFLIAQDVQKVLPEVIDEDENGMMSVRYTEVIPLLVAAIQEQQALIVQLQADVAALKGTK